MRYPEGEQTKFRELRLFMKPKTILRAALPAFACSVAFCATEVWNIKDSSIWSDSEANQVLNNSPWAKQVKAKPAQAGAVRRGGGGRGMGRRGGIGYPGGGGGGRTSSDQPMSALVRWESAKPIQEAETRLQKLRATPDSQPTDGSAEPKPAANPFENHYVISVIGLRAAAGGSGQLRDQLMTYTQLVMKNRGPLSPDDIKVKNRDGANEIQFLFPKTSPIAKDDKEVTFRTTIGRLKVENKFDLRKMTRNRKLELD
jgi:hypothetical protein